MSVTVCDSIMGSVKSYSTIRYMNEYDRISMLITLYRITVFIDKLLQNSTHLKVALCSVKVDLKLREGGTYEPLFTIIIN